MTDTKFTPGPWDTRKPKGEHRVFVMDGVNRIATVAYGGGSMPADHNAALIAAAPQLFECLEYLHDQLFECEKTYGESAVFLQIEHVLIKARGKTQ